MKKIALHIIAKDENNELKRIINDYGKYFDEIAIAYDFDSAIVDIESNDKVKLHKYEWCDDFAHKRNFLVDKTESEYYFRLDTDDEIFGVENLRKVIDKMDRVGIDVVMVPYLYSFDSDGNCNAQHVRETIVKKSDKIKWNKAIHENLLADDIDDYDAIVEKSIVIKHNIDEEHIISSGKRNFKLLLKEYNEDKENTDPRTIAYLGRMLITFGEYEKAIHFLKLLVEKSGWVDDKYFAWIDMAQAYIALGKIDIAIACCNEALALRTDFPDAYNVLGQCYVYKEDYDMAIDWLKIGLSKPEPKTNYVVDPSAYTVRAVMNMAIALFGQGNFQMAYEFYSRAYRVAPNNEFIKNQKQLFEDAVERDTYFKHLRGAHSFVKRYEPDKLIDLVNSIPSKMMVDERIQTLKHMTLPAQKWSDNSVVIFCGSAWEDWAPHSVVSGIGGSEEAVIYVSKELSKLGYDVTVFNSCGDFAGKYEGVTYRPFFEFNPRDEYNTIISWRRDIFNGHISAKNKIVWLHDVPVPGVFQKEYNFDKVLVLSEYHKSLLPKDIPEEKIFVTTNGINIKDFKDYAVERNPHRMIYTSSYDRGITNLLEVWSDVKKEVPDAELHIFYGWQSFDKIRANDSTAMAEKERIIQLMKQDGVTEHGRVGHRALNKEFARSKFWVYPSHFPEISCISAMKAQAMGCVPVCTDYAALSETVKDGVIVKGLGCEKDVKIQYKDALIKALKEQPSVDIDKEQFGWDKVAQSWSKYLFPHETRACARI